MNNWNSNILNVLKITDERVFRKFLEDHLNEHDPRNLEGEVGTISSIAETVYSGLKISLIVKHFPDGFDFHFAIQDEQNPREKSISWRCKQTKNFEEFVQKYKNFDVEQNILRRLRTILNSGKIYLCDTCDCLTGVNNQGFFLCDECSLELEE